MPSEGFWSFDVGHVFVIAGLVFTYLNYTRIHKQDQKKQIEMHAENQQRLNTLGEFHEDQLLLNNKRDEQIHQLATQTATLAELAKGLGRRLEMLEDRSDRRHQRS